MTRGTTIVATALMAAALLAGCSSTPSAAPTTPAPTPKATPGWAFCNTFVPGMSDYASYILDTSKGNFSSAEHATAGAYIAAMRRNQPTGETTLVDDYASPYDAIAVVVKAGGGALNFKTDRFKAAIVPLMAYCNGVGYKLPG